MNKYQVQVDGVTYDFDGIWWDYPQTDSESSGASENNVMYREVLPERMKFGVQVMKPNESRCSTLLKMCKKESASVNFYDLREMKRVTRTMYIVSDQVNAELLHDGTFNCDDFEIRFIQMVPDNI